MQCRILRASTVYLAILATPQFRGSTRPDTSSAPRDSARLQARYDTQITNQPNGAPVANVINNFPGPRTTTNALSFQEFTLYPLTGAWGKYFGSLAELSVSPEDVFEIENAYVRFVFGNSDKFFTSRIA